MKCKKSAISVSAGFIFCSLFVSPVFGQISPGGLGTSDITAWFRADDLSPGNVTSWSTTFPSGTSSITVSDAQDPYPQLVTTPAGAVSNYNHTLQFSGNSYAGQNPANLQGLSTTTALDLLDNAYSGNQGSFFSAYYLPQPPAANGHMLLYNEGNDAIQLRNLNTSGRIALGLLSSNSTNASRDWAEDFRPNLTSYRGNRSASTSMNGYNKGALLPTPSTASQSSGINGLYIGYSPTIATSAYNGFIHEFIFFDRDLTDLEMSKVHTYLAIKYGVTLSNAAGGVSGDYVATNGTVIWDADNQSNYHQDVIGIGRDDIEGLYQRQSHAFDDSMRIYLSTLAASNALNTGMFNSDISYVMLGHNGGLLCGTPLAASEVPDPAITSRLDREFKFTKSNFSQLVNWDITIDTCSSITGVDPANIRLLIDTDGDFTDAQSFGTADGLTFIVNGATLSILGISDAHIPNGTTRFATIGYQDVSFSISGSTPICSGSMGYVVFDIQNALAPITINYTDGTTNYTLNGVVDGDTLFLSPNTTTTYSFEPIAQLLNCCGSNAAMDVTLLVHPTPVIAINASATMLCEGDNLVLTASGADSYQWSHGVNNGQAFQPLTNNTYVVTGETNEGCAATDSIAITVNPLPAVSIPDAVLMACEGDPVTYTAIGAENYVWSGGLVNGEPFSAQSGTWTYTVTGTDANGCSDTEQVTLEVDAMPDAQAIADVTSGIAPLTVVFDNLSTDATSYSWNFGNGLGSTDAGSVSTNYAYGGTYTVSLTAFNGLCEDVWTEIIFVESGEITVEIPNVFTPNSDGANDVYVIHTENVAAIEGSILNRWGTSIFTFDTVDFSWSGVDAPDGVYTILYKATGLDGTVITGQGFIHIQR